MVLTVRGLYPTKCRSRFSKISTRCSGFIRKSTNCARRRPISTNYNYSATIGLSNYPENTSLPFTRDQKNTFFLPLSFFLGQRCLLFIFPFFPFLPPQEIEHPSQNLVPQNPWLAIVTRMTLTFDGNLTQMSNRPVCLRTKIEDRSDHHKAQS